MPIIDERSETLEKNLDDAWEELKRSSEKVQRTDGPSMTLNRDRWPILLSIDLRRSWLVWEERLRPSPALRWGCSWLLQRLV